MTMNKTAKACFLVLVEAAGFLIVIISTDSSMAWHTQFPSKKACTDFMKNQLGNSSSQANVMCLKIIPH